MAFVGAAAGRGSRPWTKRVVVTGALLATAVASTAAGVVVVAGTSRFGSAAPYVLLAVPLVPLAAALIVWKPLLGVIAVLAAFPIATVPVPGAVVELQLVEAVALIVTALIALRRLGTGLTMLPWPPALWWALALLAWVLIALPSALDQELAIKQVASLAGGLLLATTIYAACRTTDNLRAVLGFFVVLATVIAVVAILEGGAASSRFGGAVIEQRAESAFDQPNQLGSFSASACFLAFGLALGARSRAARIGSGIAIAVLVGGLMVSLSRGAWIGAVLALIVVLVALPRARRLVLALSLPLIIVAALLGAFGVSAPQIQVVQERFGAITVLSPYDDRDAIWAEAFREIRDDPWTGQGPGNFPVASTRAASESASVFADHAHNLLLTWAAESGLPAALFIVGLIAALFVVAQRASRAAAASEDLRDRALVIGTAAALTTMLGQGLVDYTFRNQVIFFTVWLLVGALLVAARQARTESTTEAAR